MESKDVIIVGGGVIGCSIAWQLAKRKIGRVLLLEKSFLGAGSSGKSGAIIRQHYSTKLSVQMARLSLRVFEQFPEIVGGPPVFSHTGLVLVMEQKDRPALEANLQMQKSLGVDVDIVSHQQLTDIDPHVFLSENEIAAFEKEAGYVEAVQVVASFASAARREGADIREGVEVKDIHVKSGKVTAVETNEGTYHCGKVVLATGPWAGVLSNKIGFPLPVQPSRTQVALYRRPTDFGKATKVYADFVHGVYFKPTHGEMMHGGSLRGEEIDDKVNPDDYPESADSEWLPKIRNGLCRRYPTLHKSFGRGGYGALYGITPDWHPILDRLPGIEGAYCAVGFSGHGFKLSPIVGQLMTEMIVDGSAHSLDISAFRSTRFQENALVSTPYSYGVMG